MFQVRPAHPAAALLTALLVLTALPAAARQDTIMGGPPPMPTERFVPDPQGLSMEVYASGLEVVWGMAFAPDGRLFVTERPGRVRIVGPGGTLDPRPWLTLAVPPSRTEGGLMGIALHPDFPDQPYVYLMYTAANSSGRPGINRVSRFREVDGSAGPEEIILDDLPAASNHNGGRIRFGPDGMLYVCAGENFQRERAQDLSDPAGSVLRITPEGEVPADNPWPGNPIWTYGNRNPQGLAWQPGTGVLFEAEHGPSGEMGVRDRDEVNILVKGQNYGWPLAVGAPGAEGLVDPLLMWIPAMPPGDLVFYDADLISDLKGDLLMTSLRGQCMVRIRFEDPSAPRRVTALERWWLDADHTTRFGRLRALAVGPDGALYVGTSNRDGRGRPREGDDRILRFYPTPRR